MMQLFRNQNVTFSEVLTLWLERTRPRVKGSTYSTYAGAAERHVRPELGGLTPRQLTNERVGKFLASVSAELSPATARIICHVLRSALAQGRAMGLRYPADLELSVPGGGGREARLLNPAERRRLEDSLRARTDGAALGLLLCLFTGIRLGELCALRWGDLSPDGTELIIRRTLQRLPTPGGASKTALVFGTPKSASSNRRIPLPACLLEDVRRLRGPDEAFLLTGEVGRALEPRLMEARFKTALRQAGLPDVNFHALRHTFATGCIDRGCDPATLARILGHADVSVTLNTYVHPSFEAMRRAIDMNAAGIV